MDPVALSLEATEDAAAVLARAFHHNPGDIYFFPDPNERVRFTRDYFRVMVRHGLAFGIVRVIGEPMFGVAIWAPPDTTETGGDPIAGHDELPEDVQAWPEPARERLRNLHTHFASMHARLIHGSHWQLLYLGIEPERQRQGWASALIRPMLAEIDAQGLPCILQNLDPRNIPFYEQHGFRILERDTLRGTDMPIWEMRRG